MSVSLHMTSSLSSPSLTASLACTPVSNRGRPSRRALAHISGSVIFPFYEQVLHSISYLPCHSASYGCVAVGLRPSFQPLRIAAVDLTSALSGEMTTAT